jgi:hypothetical protein
MGTVRFICLAMPMLCVGCAAPETPLSPMQKRQITTKQIEGSYENVYRAAMTVTQDQGYILKNTDMNSGLIVAAIDRETSKSSQFWQEFWMGSVYDKGTFIELTLTVGKISEALQEVRMSLQESRYNQFGGKTDIKQVLDPQVYQELANQIIVEVKRREALGR